MFRMLRLLACLGDRSIEAERLRILDFYVLFLALLRDIQLPMSARKSKPEAQNEANAYESLQREMATATSRCISCFA